jgi:hypothetical protein
VLCRMFENVMRNRTSINDVHVRVERCYTWDIATLVCNLLYIFGTDKHFGWDLGYVTCFFSCDCYIQKSVKFKNRFLKVNTRFPEITRNMCCMYPYVVTQHMHSYDIYFTMFENKNHLLVSVAVAIIDRVF